MGLAIVLQILFLDRNGLSSGGWHSGQTTHRSSTGIIPDVDFFDEANRLLDAAVSENIKRAYASETRSFDEFRSVYNRSLDWQPSLLDVVDFIAHLSAGLLTPSTVRSYISAVSYRCKKTRLCRSHAIFCSEQVVEMYVSFAETFG